MEIIVPSFLPSFVFLCDADARREKEWGNLPKMERERERERERRRSFHEIQICEISRFFFL